MNAAPSLRRRLPLVGATAIVIALAALGIGRAAEGPPYRDQNRSLNDQKEVEKAAKAVAEGGPKNAAKVVSLLGDESGLVRDRVFWVIDDDWSSDDIAALAPGLKARDEIAVRNVAELLGMHEVASARSDLAKALKKSHEPLTQVEILRALGAVGEEGDLRDIEKLIKRAKHPHVQAAALVAATRIDAAGAMKRLEDACDADNVLLYAAALHRMAEVDRGKAVERAIVALGVEVKGRVAVLGPRLLFAALGVFDGIDGDDRGKHADGIKKAIPALIARLEREDGRGKHDTAETLRWLTGQHDLGDEAFTWTAWWEPNAESFDPGKVGEKDGDGPAPVKTVVRYHGIPIYSKRLAFILDLSGGMTQQLEGKEFEGMTRLDYAKKELTNVLKQLDDDVAVNIFFFGSDFASAADRLAPLKKSRRAFTQWVMDRQVSSTKNMFRSNIFDPMVTALDDPTIDTIFLLSEGFPTEGLYQRRSRFLFHLKDHNVLAQTRIHALYIGSADSGRRFVKAVAEAGRGRYYDVAERGNEGDGK